MSVGKGKVWLFLGVLLGAAAARGHEEATFRFLFRPGEASQHQVQVRGRLRLVFPQGEEERRLEGRFLYRETPLRQEKGIWWLQSEVGALVPSSPPTSFLWSVRMPPTGREPEFPSLKEQSFRDLAALGGLHLFVETSRILAFPDEAIQPKARWQVELRIGVKNGSIRVQGEAEFKGWVEEEGEKVARFGLSFHGEQRFEEVQLSPQHTVLLEGDQEGEIEVLFSPQQGRILQSEGEMKVRWEVRPLLSPQKGEPLPQSVMLEMEFLRKRT